jgi:predicted MPP superfamily phosphohydrolase
MGWKFVHNILPFIAVVILCALALQFFGMMEVRLGPLDLEFRMRWSAQGETRLVLPPVGEVKASTHRLPVTFSLRLNRIDHDLLQAEVERTEQPADYLENLLPSLRRVFIMFLVHLLLLGMLCGVLTGMIFWGWREYRRWTLSLLVGLVFTAMVLGGVALSYDQSAFDNPRYEGILEGAPWLLDLLDKGLAQLDTLGRKMEVVAGNLNRLFSQVDQLDSLAQADGELKVIHVSDIHNNPAAFDFLTRVAEGFGADLIIDTGDLTDYGTNLEAQLSTRIANLGTPYFFVPGNHDSPDVISRLRRIRNVKILDSKPVSYKGLTVLGLPDPASRNGRLMASVEELLKSADALETVWENMAQPPDLVAVHNIDTADKLLGRVQVVLHGHDHKARIYNEGDTKIIDAGSSGAAGVRALENESVDGVPFSLALLRFDRPGDGERYLLTAVDMIRVYSLNGRFVLERKVINGGETDAALSGGLAESEDQVGG